MGIKILPMEVGDIPQISAVATAAFADDAHSILKEHAEGAPMNTVNMDSSWYESYLTEEDPVEAAKAVMTVAVEVDDVTGEVNIVEEGTGAGRRRIVGSCAWGRWNYDGKVEDIPGQPDPRIESYTLPVPPSDATPVTRLKHVQSQHMRTTMLSLNPPGGKNMYIFGITVDPAHQGKGIGRALLRHGFDLADADGVYVWVHASEAGYPMFVHMGFEEVARQELDLDAHANGVRWVDRKGVEKDWGVYSLRYCVRMPTSGPVELKIEKGRVDRY